MPNQTGVRAAPYAPQTVRREMTGGGPNVPVSAAISTLAPNLFVKAWQVGGVFNQIVPATIAGLTANATAIVRVPPIQLAPGNVVLSSGGGAVNPAGILPFPSVITLGSGQTAMVVVSVSLAPLGGGAPAAAPFIGLPYVQITFQQGTNAASVATTMSSTLLLSGPGNYSIPALVISLPVFATSAGFGTQTINLAV
jgi:hypothetical protein